MKNKKVIDPKNLPIRLPFWPTLLAVLSLDYWSAPEWMWGTVICLLAIWWFIALWVVDKEEKIDLMSERWIEIDVDTARDDLDKKQKSKFQQRLEEAMKAAQKAKSNN